MRFFISGVNGFIGKALANKLLQEGHSVKGIGKSPYSEVKGVDYFSCDVCDKNALKVNSEGCEIFIHLAAITAHEEIVNKPMETLEVNIEGTLNMLKAFSFNQGKHFIYFSTGKVYGNFESLPLKESMPAKPINILGKSKYICEQLVDFQSFIDQQSSFSILRVFNIYGQGQKESFLVPTIIKQIEKQLSEKKQCITIKLGDIKARRDYLDRDDLVKATMQIIKNGGTKGLNIFNVGSGKGCSAEEIVKEIAIIIGREIKIESDEKKIRKDELDEEYADNSKLMAIGWKSETNLEDGLRKMIKIN